MQAMDIKLTQCFIAVDDHDKALAFYRDVLGLEVRNDVGFEGMRWVTVGSPSQPDVDIVLEPPLPHPNASPADKQAMAELLAKGLLPWGHLRDRRLRRHLRAHPRRGRRGTAGADRPALRRPRLRLPRSLRQHAALQPASQAVSTRLCARSSSAI